MILAAIGAVIARFEPAGSLAMPSELTSLSALVGVGLILAALAVVSFVTGTWSDTGDSSGQAPKLVVPAGKAVIGFVDVGEGKSSVSVSAGNDLVNQKRVSGVEQRIGLVRRARVLASRA